MASFFTIRNLAAVDGIKSFVPIGLPRCWLSLAAFPWRSNPCYRCVWGTVGWVVQTTWLSDKKESFWKSRGWQTKDIQLRSRGADRKSQSAEAWGVVGRRWPTSRSMAALFERHGGRRWRHSTRWISIRHDHGNPKSGPLYFQCRLAPRDLLFEVLQVQKDLALRASKMAHLAFTFDSSLDKKENLFASKFVFQYDPRINFWLATGSGKFPFRSNSFSFILFFSHNIMPFFCEGLNFEQLEPEFCCRFFAWKCFMVLLVFAVFVSIFNASLFAAQGYVEHF